MSDTTVNTQQTFDDFLLKLYVNPDILNLVAPTSIQTLNGVTEEDEKLYIQRLLNLIEFYSKDDSNLVYGELADVNVAATEYSNIFSINRCLRRLLENDIDIFNKNKIFTILYSYNSLQTYKKNDRIIYYKEICQDSTSPFRIYVCVKNNVINTPPTSSNSLPYYKSIAVDPDNIPSNIVWIEDVITLDSFINGSNGESWDEFNAKLITDLPSFSFADSSLPQSKTLELNNLRRLKKPTEPFSWPDNTPIIYSDISISSLIEDDDILLYKNDNTLFETIISSDGGDYIVSTEVSTYKVGEAEGILWYNKWNSGWVEQGGRQPVIIDDTNSAKHITLGEDTKLIGVSNKSNICITYPISSFTKLKDVETLSFNYSLNEISAEVPNVTVPFVRIYNKQVVFNDTNLVYSSPSAVIAGVLLSSNNIMADYKEGPLAYTNGTKLSTYINWESRGFITN